MNEKVKNIVIEEFDRVDAAFKTFRYDLKVNNKIGNCLELDLLESLVKEIINNFGKYKESQQDLIKGKDEYIAKLCNDRAELKEHEKELIAEQHRLFDLAKEQEIKLNKLEKFAKVISRSVEFNEFGSTDAYYNTANVINKDTIVNEDVDLVKKVVEKYGKS